MKGFMGWKSAGHLYVCIVTSALKFDAGGGVVNRDVSFITHEDKVPNLEIGNIRSRERTKYRHKQNTGTT